MTEVEQQTRWSCNRVSRVSLALAFIVPIAAAVFGSAIGEPLTQLGGIMIGFWGFALASLCAAILDFGNRSKSAGRWLLFVGTLIVLPPGVKIVAALPTQPAMVVKTAEGPVSVPASASPRCRPELVSSNSGPVSYSKRGGSGRLAWFFWVGNYYEWQLSGSIAADASGAFGTASAVGTVSAWNSVRRHPKSAEAVARGSIDCVASAAECVCFSGGASDKQSAGDLLATVIVQREETHGGAVLDVSSSAEVSGTPGSAVKIGVKGIGLDLQGPNTALDAATKSKSYAYRCQQVPAGSN